MTDEIDDNDFFQQDFTTTTEWEIFNARLEEIFHEWRLPFIETGEPLTKNQLSLCEWEFTSEDVSCADFQLNVTRYKAKIPHNENKKAEHDKLNSADLNCQAFLDVISAENNYCVLDEKCENSIHKLARWYGLRDFVVVSPVEKSISNESQIRILLSSIHIAVSESSCEIPVFIQVLDKIQNVYLGVCEYHSTRLNFDIVHLQTTPTTCKYLSGLLNMFKGKIGVQYIDPVIVTIRLSYSLTRFLNSNYNAEKKYAFCDFYEDEDNKNNDKFNVLPFGVAIDPIMEIILYCTWPQVAENLVIDSSIYTDLNPMIAPTISIRARFEDTPICYMSECITEYLQLTHSQKTLSELLGDHFIYTGNAIEKNPFEALTQSKIPTISSVIPNLSSKSDAKKQQKTEGPLNSEQLMQMLYYLFPDAQQTSNFAYTPRLDNEPFDPLRIKTAHNDSLVHRLSSMLALCNTYFGGVKAVAQFWAEFAQEMRYRLERCIQIPGVACGFPDSRTCLLHQKLQMLNICMERRRIREGGLPFSMTQSKRNSGDADSDDEFFDCSDEDEDNKRHAPWNKPEGRLSRLGILTLVDSDEPLYVPITQDPVPKTEDQLEDDAEVMLQLGPGSELRAQMMSASLLSDMESFKAANPSGKIEDFIRWYSPRDWIQEDEEGNKLTKKGCLSPRMLIPGNTWQMVWSTAKPVSARRQKRLFDDAKEAEKVLYYFETRNIGQISRLTIGALFHSAIVQTQEESTEFINFSNDFIENLDKIVANCCKLSRENWMALTPNSKLNSKQKWENLLADITNLEYFVEQTKSLKKKLFPNSTVLNSDDKKIIESLLKGYETELDGGAKNEIAVRVLNMFTDLKKAQNELMISADGDPNSNLSLPNPIEKQFTLRVSGKTLNKGNKGPQFMRAILGQNEFRLCGAFSQNTTFF